MKNKLVTLISTILLICLIFLYRSPISAQTTSTPTATPSAELNPFQNQWDLFLYIIFSAVYIMVVHFAMAIRNEFNAFLTIIFFVLGGVIGWWMHSYEMGFAAGIILSLLFW